MRSQEVMSDLVDRFEAMGLANFLRNFLQKSPCRPAAGRPGADHPAAGRPGYIPVNFENENIFL